MLYSYWDDGSSEVGEAIEIFDELIKAQNAERRQYEEFAKTYLHYGELHAYHGRKSKAKEIWQQGLAKFPKNDELKAKLR